MTTIRSKKHPSRAKTIFSRTQWRRTGPRRLGRRCSSNGGRLQAGIQKHQTDVPNDSKSHVPGGCCLSGFAFAVAFASGLCSMSVVFPQPLHPLRDALLLLLHSLRTAFMVVVQHLQCLCRTFTCACKVCYRAFGNKILFFFCAHKN